MSAVELWKAPQPLLFQGRSADSSKWRAVGNSKNTLPKPCALNQNKIFSTVLNRISIFSPTPIHNSSLGEFSRGNALHQADVLHACDRYSAI